MKKAFLFVFLLSGCDRPITNPNRVGFLMLHSQWSCEQTQLPSVCEDALQLAECLRGHSAYCPRETQYTYLHRKGYRWPDE